MLSYRPSVARTSRSHGSSRSADAAAAVTTATHPMQRMRNAARPRPRATRSMHRTRRDASAGSCGPRRSSALSARAASPFYSLSAQIRSWAPSHAGGRTAPVAAGVDALRLPAPATAVTRQTMPSQAATTHGTGPTDRCTAMHSDGQRSAARWRTAAGKGALKSSVGGPVPYPHL
jgi:hypothetical protein